MQTPNSDAHAIELQDLTKVYPSGGSSLTVLEAINFQLPVGQRLAIVGPSGSGKTTLLGLCAGLDQATSGKTILLGNDLSQLDEDGRAAFRGEHIGFVFQNFQLIPSLTALENVAIPLQLRGEANAQEPARVLLERVGLGDRLDHYPIQLSGGEQQRVALARAFINRPKILFADEPTGNLDGKNGEHIVELLFEMNASEGTTLVLVTHDSELANHCNRIITIQNGRIQSDKELT